MPLDVIVNNELKYNKYDILIKIVKMAMFLTGNQTKNDVKVFKFIL